jgi:hypothetical protein
MAGSEKARAGELSRVILGLGDRVSPIMGPMICNSLKNCDH